MASLFLCAVLVTGQASSASNPAPLTEEQLTRLRELVRSTQRKAEGLRQELADRERQLAEKYGQFELDEAAAEKLQSEIVNLQKQLLANYHHLQVELRKVVGPERFAQLKLRLDNALRPRPKAERPPEPSRPSAPEGRTKS
jgi:hypothetical protein